MWKKVFVSVSDTLGFPSHISIIFVGQYRANRCVWVPILCLKMEHSSLLDDNHADLRYQFWGAKAYVYYRLTNPSSTICNWPYSTLNWESWDIPCIPRIFYIPYITGWWFQPLWKILVSWDYYSQYMEKIKHVPNHQPDKWHFLTITDIFLPTWPTSHRKFTSARHLSPSKSHITRGESQDTRASSSGSWGTALKAGKTARFLGNHHQKNGKETHLKPTHTHHQRYFGKFFMLTSHENQCGMDWSQDGAIQKVKEDPRYDSHLFLKAWTIRRKWSLHGTFEQHRTHQPDIWLPPVIKGENGESPYVWRS